MSIFIFYNTLRNPIKVRIMFNFFLSFIENVAIISEDILQMQVSVSRIIIYHLDTLNY